jgi:hypothetical protein
VKIGDCIKFVKPGNPIPHCWFVVAENAAGECVIVNMTTIGHVCDKTVVLHEGDHPSIEHDSIILYSDAQVTSFSVLEKLLRAGTINPKPSCSPELLKKLRDGIPASPETKDKILIFCGYPPRTKKP